MMRCSLLMPPSPPLAPPNQSHVVFSHDSLLLEENRPFIISTVLQAGEKASSQKPDGPQHVPLVAGATEARPGLAPEVQDRSVLLPEAECLSLICMEPT